MMAVVLGAGYATAAFVAVDGILARGIGRAWLRWRVACEDQLAAIWRLEEAASRDAPAPAGRGGLLAAGAGGRGSGAVRLSGREAGCSRPPAATMPRSS